MRNIKTEFVFVFFVILLLVLLKIVLASPPVWNSGSDTANYTTIEDSFYFHNFSANITGFTPFILLTNSNTENLTINATYDNQTGFFSIPIQATNTSNSEGSITTFEYIINATNDAPAFTSVDSPFNLTQSLNFLNFLNGSDEESHYPLNFTVTFYSNCTHATWTGRTNGQNCSLPSLGFSLTDFSNTSALMNFTPVSNDVGTYWANISVKDFGGNYNCPHSYCDNSTYKVNKTTNYSGVVVFNVFSTLDINATDCQNKVFQENQAGTCNVTIRTKSETASL